ncbi:Catalase [Mycobacteroides abscessus subsp. massiliense]|nr:Catalase [Mycobacteroides abscessus subsp. massiliense]
MLLGRVFAYADAHRYRIGTNYAQLPPNEARAATVNSYSKEGAMRYHFNDPEVPVYAPNSFGGPHGVWDFDGTAVRAGYVQHAEDDDFVQAGTLVREVLDDEQRARLASNIVGHVLGGVSEPVLSRVFEYWKNVDPELGKAVEEGVRAGLDAQ